MKKTFEQKAEDWIKEHQPLKGPISDNRREAVRDFAKFLDSQEPQEIELLEQGDEFIAQATPKYIFKMWDKINEIIKDRNTK